MLHQSLVKGPEERIPVVASITGAQNIERAVLVNVCKERVEPCVSDGDRVTLHQIDRIIFFSLNQSNGPFELAIWPVDPIGVGFLNTGVVNIKLWLDAGAQCSNLSEAAIPPIGLVEHFLDQ